MTDDKSAALSELLGKIQFLLKYPIDFTAADTRTTLAKVHLLAAAATYFNVVVVSDFGGRGGPARGEGLAEQAVGAAFQTYAGEDPHPGSFEKAAMLLRGITQGHPFNDGNKRTGFLLAAYYLDLVGYPLPEKLAVDDVVDLCVRVSAGDLRDVAVIAEELRRLWAGVE